MRPIHIAILQLALLPVATARNKPRVERPPACQRETIEGELNSGQPFSQEIGGNLRVFFQPIHSGWILRVLPASGPQPAHDFAELATPPYNSVTPLSISTDFAFRAQDAIGWNPRRFRFAVTPASRSKLESSYARLEAAGWKASPEAEAALARAIAETASGTFTILDSRLSPGGADQWRMAAAVASHFESTAHTVVLEPGGHITPLGRLLWVSFRLELDLPAGFHAAPGAKLQPHSCDAS